MQGSQKIRDFIFSAGFDAVGIAPYAVLATDRERLGAWLAEECHGELAYMEAHARWDPRIVLPSCRSLVVVLFGPQVERYHTPIRKRLKKLLRDLQELDPTIEGRAVVDTAPVLEKSWAVRAGLGSIGKNTLLVHPTLGTDFNIGILLLNIELPYDPPFEGDLCGACTLCLEHCPSGALLGDRTLDCRICRSYLSQRTVGAPYGCRICQQACPRNEKGS